MSHPVLICTVGTSLFRPNLERLKSQLDQGRVEPTYERLAKAYSQSNWSAVAAELANLPATDRICGAEINSIAGMIDKGYAEPRCGLFFLHSQTEQGRDIAAILKQYYLSRGHQPVEVVEVADLQDADPKRFRSKGLRNLGREIAKIVRERSPAACAINATGGYKAQIAIGVILGQALGLTVYYKHEQFDEVIAFPPLPVALDFGLWMQASGLLANLASASNEPVPAARYKEEWDERYESLVERVQIDGEEYLELSPTGQIFHETFRDRFRSAADLVLPPPAPAKREPRLEQAGWPGEHPEVKQFMERVTSEVPFVVRCATFYFNPRLPEQTRFLLSRGDVIGQFSDGRYCVKIRVETTAQTDGQRQAAVAALNEWLQDRNYFRTPKEISAERAANEAAEAWSAWEQAEARLEELRRRNEEVEKQSEQLRGENEQLRRELDAIRAQLVRTENERRGLTEQIAGLQGELNAQRTAADEVTQQLSDCRQALAEARIPWWRRLLGRWFAAR